MVEWHWSCKTESSGQLNPAYGHTKEIDLKVFDVSDKCVWPQQKTHQQCITKLDKNHFKDAFPEEELSDHLSLRLKTGPKEFRMVNWVAECDPKLFRQIVVRHP